VADVTDELQRMLVVRLQRLFEPASLRLARKAVGLWRQDHNLRVVHVARELGVTARHLRRSFIESVGVRPKEFARMARLEKAVRAAPPSIERDWTRVAVDTGYYDQSHLIAEFRESSRCNARRVHRPQSISGSALRQRMPLRRERRHTTIPGLTVGAPGGRTLSSPA
jgi:AraC-like DNA-binding protein